MEPLIEPGHVGRGTGFKKREVHGENESVLPGPSGASEQRGGQRSRNKQKSSRDSHRAFVMGMFLGPSLLSGKGPLIWLGEGVALRG